MPARHVHLRRRLELAAPRRPHGLRPVPAGPAQRSRGASVHPLCDPGRFSLTNDTSQTSTCELCPAGFFQPLAGNATSRRMPAGVLPGVERLRILPALRAWAVRKRAGRGDMPGLSAQLLCRKRVAADLRRVPRGVFQQSECVGDVCGDPGGHGDIGGFRVLPRSLLCGGR